MSVYPYESEQPAPMTSRANLIDYSTMSPAKVQWLWPGHLALGKLTLFSGNPDLGKSFVALTLAAQLSTGRGWPDAATTPVPVAGSVVVSAEDDAEDTVLPRYLAAGGDKRMMKGIRGVKRTDENGESSDLPFNLARDREALIEAIDATSNCKLVVLDTVGDFLGGADSHRNSDVREVLHPVARLAAVKKVAIILLAHLNKKTGDAPIYRTLGSIGFVGLARQVWGFVEDKDAPGRRLMLPVKSNLCPKPKGLAFQLEPSGNDPDVGAVKWLGEVDDRIEDQLGSRAERDGGCSREEAKEWLLDVLANGPVSSTDIYSWAAGMCVGKRTLDRAKKELGVQSQRMGFGAGSRVEWLLPRTGSP